MKKILLALAMVCGLFGSTAAQAADQTAVAVDPAKLATFMEKWKTYESFKFPTAAEDQPLLLAALAKEPAGPWYAYLSMQFAGTAQQLRTLPEKERPAAAAKAADTLKQAGQILNDALQKDAAGSAELKTERAMLRQMLAPILIEAGPAYFPEARAMGEDMLAHLPATNAWDYGNIIYGGNQLLGQIALREGKPKEARDFLHQAGQTPGSPQLNSFGPDNLLARDLLHHGEPADREAVLAYLDDIARFWANPDKAPSSYKEYTVKKRQQIETWKTAIRAGNIPEGPNWR
ncbi:MAG: hypothetical protein WCH99_11725 [Verrucomicrobiota bacterium]